MNKFLARLAFVCLALVAIVPMTVSAQSATETESAGSNVLSGTHWQVVAIDGTPVIDGSTITLDFDDVNASGNAGCNGYNGGYTVNGSAITFEPLMMTRMACVDNAVTQQESAYIGLLQAAKTFEQGEDTLTIATADGKKITFQAAASDPLAGTQWTLVSYGSVDNRVPVIEGSKVTLGFDTMGYVYGSGGCNDIGGHYQVQGDKVAFGMITTDKACLDEAITKQEAAFFDALATPAPYHLDGDTLTFDYGTNERLVLQRVTLVGSSWQLMSYGPTDTPIPTIPDIDITLNFTNETQIAGNGGCNGYGGEYQVSYSQITFSQVISTMMACVANGITEQEQAYFAALQTAADFTLNGDTLTINYQGGTLTFARLPSPDATPEATAAATQVAMSS